MSLPTVTMSGKQLVAREAPHVRAKLPEAGLHLVGDEDAAGLAHHLHGRRGIRPERSERRCW
jgi:hypothetical protein